MNVAEQKNRYVFNALAWSSILILAVLSTGCSKQRAELAIRKSQQNVKLATEWKAAEFQESKNALAAAQSSLKSAEDSMNGKQYPAALTQANEAVKQSNEALNSAKTRFADKQLQAARKDMEIANINDGRTENPDLFGAANKKVTGSAEKYQKQKYEDSINLSNGAIEDVRQLLAHVKNTAENSLAELNIKISELEKWEAQTFLPHALIRAKEARDRIKDKIEKDRDYKQANLVAKVAISDADTNIIETKKRKSQLELSTLESKLAEAIAEEATIYAPEMLTTCRESFDEILKSHYDQQFDTVIAASNLLKPRVDQLIVMTRIEATKDKIETVNKSIANLKDQAVEQYLPGRVKVMEDLLAQARDLFANNDYDGAKEKATQALVEQDRIVANFDALTERTIQDAEAAYKAAQKTYDKMATFFTGEKTGRLVDRQISGRREVESTNLSARLESALLMVKNSAENRTQKQFKKAIENAKEAQSVSEDVVSNTFRIVAEHSLLAIQDEISELERQGAQTQAKQEIEQVQGLVEETQQLLTEKHNREAADRAAKTRAYLDNVKQALARRATEERVRGTELLRRIEQGGAVPTPATGGQKPVVPAAAPNGQAPGGSSEGNRESMLEDAVQAIGAKPAPVLVAQLNSAGPPTNSTGYMGGQSIQDNRALPSGTFMTDRAPYPGVSAAPRTGEPNGAIIGTRPEPIVTTRENPAVGGSEKPYEPPTGPGPFAVKPATGAPAPMAAGGDLVPAPANPSDEQTPENIQSIRNQVESILSDEQRMRDIRRFEEPAIDTSREKLEQSARALESQQYLQALNLAQEAQRVILEAEIRAARSAARENLQKSADRINVAEAAGSIMFAPAQLTEAIRLYDQAESAMNQGDFLAARDLSARAVVAADDARLYNVNKARDLAALSTRYGGWKVAHPDLVQAEAHSEQAEDLLRSPQNAQAGQELAKQAVTEAQIALDHARDFTFQERIDNIYKALNNALRAGANYFNVNEVKKLIAELSVARDEYCTRNFDAVELKLKDVEARLARVIETTPLVLEENLVENTNKLNALVQAGAENYMAQEVENVKSLMNRSVIDFRKHDYYSSYVNIRSAIKLTDQIEQRLQEQVYFDSVTELFAQLDVQFRNFERILGVDRVFLKKLINTEHGTPAAISFAGDLNPNDFRDKITDIYLRAIHLKPPKSQEATHEQVLIAIKFAKVAAENFQKLYIMDQLSRPDAYDVIDSAFNQIRKSKTLRSEVQLKMIDPQARTKVIRAEKIVNF